MTVHPDSKVDRIPAQFLQQSNNTRCINMLKIIIKAGRIGVTVLITLITVILSLLITVLIMETFGNGVGWIDISVAIVAPVIISPLVSWYLMGLLIKIHDLEKEQRKLATYDGLTGVMARSAFLTNFHTLITVAERNNQPISIATLDLDNFKKINDQYGHAGGDAVLKSFTAILKNQLRKSDLIGRIGGEEFALIFLDSAPNESLKVLEKIRLSSENNTISYMDMTIQYTVSIGVTTFTSSNPVDQQELLRQSDEALYKAKGSGKNCIAIYKRDDEDSSTS